MAASDVMITCVSGISFEFLALERPVIYIDTPKFFSHYLRKLFPTQDTVSWADRMSVNGGREFGILVSHPHELPKAVEEVLSHPELYPRRKSELLRYLLYNPGEGTKAAVDQIARLLEQRVRSRRPGDQGWGLLLQMCGYVPVHTKILRKMRHTFLSKPRKLASRILNRFRSK